MRDFDFFTLRDIQENESGRAYVTIYQITVWKSSNKNNFIGYIIVKSNDSVKNNPVCKREETPK